MLVDAISITDITTHIARLFSDDPILQAVWVQGEVSNLKRHQNGHFFFTLKDAGAQLECVMWRSQAERLVTPFKDGEEVFALGTVEVYNARGTYRLSAERVRAVGIGDLFAQFERLKTKLAEEGLFDEARKRPLPLYPRVIGVVTSPEAAAYQDIQNVWRRRYPLAQIVLSPTLVQGKEAPVQIVRALERLDARDDIEVILVCRGGGSIEDLWAFNAETVARAIVNSRVPVVSGVGHETDFTIADFAADLRAPTPSAAAEQMTPHIDDLRANVVIMSSTLQFAMRDELQRRHDALNTARERLERNTPTAQIERLRERLGDWRANMDRAQRARLALLRERLAGRITALEAADPRLPLTRGYVMVTSETGVRITAANNAPPAGTRLELQFADGTITVRVERAPIEDKTDV